MNLHRSLALSRRALTLALLGLLGLGLTLGLTRGTADAAPPADQQQVRELLQVGGANYPAAVARVNNQAVDGQALARRVYIVQHSQAPGVDKANAVRTALDQLIDEQVLLQVAPSRGIAVTEADARAFAQAQQRLTTQLKSGSAREIVAIYAAQLGVPVADYYTDPRVIETYRQALILGRMRADIVETLPAAQRNDPVAQQAAIRAFVTGSGAHVEELITP